ncbi:Tol-Pal system peptidoglycan-associated lipoprotein PAL [hydrothermal vent metagenome]|uniref:Tol-Pal system peptidoglycan-associated lipoprotein PAL n=1 Tax=hydrothermal vent metagenome TaxID=652676 RepID=A0A3B0VU14_9ZZZZ
MFQLKKIFVIAVVASLASCSSPPERYASSGSDSDVMEDTAPGIQGYEGSGVEVLPLNRNGQNQGMGSAQDMEQNPMNEFQEAEMFEPVIYFGLNQYELDDAKTKTVKYFAQEMLNNERLTVKIKGHTDERGTPEYNLALGERRAKSVAEAMMLFGVVESRIEVISYGEEMPEEAGSNENAWQKNRRAELEIR